VICCLANSRSRLHKANFPCVFNKIAATVVAPAYRLGTIGYQVEAAKRAEGAHTKSPLRIGKIYSVIASGAGEKQEMRNEPINRMFMRNFCFISKNIEPPPGITDEPRSLALPGRWGQNQKMRNEPSLFGGFSLDVHEPPLLHSNCSTNPGDLTLCPN